MHSRASVKFLAGVKDGFFSSEDSKMANKIHSKQVKIDGRDVHYFTAGNGDPLVLTSRFSELVMPTLVVWGAKDEVVPVSHAYAAARVIPHCQFKVFENCGHNVHREKINEFSQLLTGFLG